MTFDEWVGNDVKTPCRSLAELAWGVAIRQEREACAKVCEEPLALEEALRHRSWWECAEAIRERERGVNHEA